MDKLAAYGVEEGQQFGRSLLLELCKSGDAYTKRAGCDIYLSGWVQISLDFTDDPVPESSVPVCAMCGSPYGLHLVSVIENVVQTPLLSIRCESCCTKQRIELGVCVPTPALTRPFVKRVMGICGIDELDETVQSYSAMQEKNYMERLFKSKSTQKHTQASLFIDAECGQQNKLF